MQTNIKNTVSLVRKTIAKRQKSRYYGLKIGLALGALVSISMLVLAGCPANNPVQEIIRDRVRDQFDRITDDSDNPQGVAPQPIYLSVDVQLTKDGETVGVYDGNDRGSVVQGDNVQITATIRNNSPHASNGHALLVFYKSNDEIVNPAIFDVDLDYDFSDSAVAAIKEALGEGYGLDPVLSAPLREQDLNQQEGADANKDSVVDAALDPIFASVVVAPLASGNTFTPDQTINIPVTVDVGSSNYGACVVLDRFSCASVALQVTRSDAHFDVRAVGAPQFTNLPSDGYYSNNAPNNVVNVTGVVENTGGLNATGVQVDLYRIVGDIDAVGAENRDDEPVGGRQTINVNANTTVNVTFTTFGVSESLNGVYTQQYYFEITKAEDLDTTNNRSDINSLLVYITSGGGTFIDSDGDRLIDIRNLEMLNNIRYNPAGTSYKTDGSAAVGDRCLDMSEVPPMPVDCIGYELMQNLDFASASSYKGYQVNADWRPNNHDPAAANNLGWAPIGGIFSAIFEGNGYTIRNLYSRNIDSDYYRGAAGEAYGLFSQVSGTIRNLNITDSAIYGSDLTDYIGTVVGYLRAGGKVINVSARRGFIDSRNAKLSLPFFNLGHEQGGGGSPRISGLVDIVGGLVGTNAGTIAASNSAVVVVGSHIGSAVTHLNGWSRVDKLGGIAGDNTRTGSIIASYSLSTVIGDGTPNAGAIAPSNSSDRIGGIAGANYGKILSSYALSNLNGQGQIDYIGGITGGLEYTTNSGSNGDAPVVFSTYSTSAMYGTAVEEFFAHRGGRQRNSNLDWNCVGPITGYKDPNQTNIEHSYFFGKIGQTNQGETCPDNNEYTLNNVGIDQLTGSNTGWEDADRYEGVSSRAWMYGGGRAAPALQYANYADYNMAEPDNNTNYAKINYCDHIGESSCSGVIPGQPLSDQGNTIGTAYPIDTLFYPGGGLSIPAKIDFAGDNDYFKITVIKAGEIGIESLHSRGVNMQVQLFNSAGALVEYDDNDGEGDNFRIYRYIPRGEYTVRAYAHGEATGSYIISMQMTGQNEVWTGAANTGASRGYGN